MALNAPVGGGGGGGDRKLCPTGSHTAVCFGVIDVGTHLKRSKQFGDKFKRQVLLRWELSDEMVAGEDGVERPMVISQRYTLSMHENAALRAVVHSWLARKLSDSEAASFDLHSLAGMPCQIVVTQDEGNDGKTYDNVASVAPLPKRMAAPTQVHDTQVYSLDDGPPPGDFPQWLKDLIGRSQEMGGVGDSAPPTTSTRQFDAPPLRSMPVPAGSDADIPF